MGLDVYVGTLTRYYQGEWDTIIQQMGAAGTDVAVVHPGQPPGGEREYAPGTGSAPQRARTARADLAGPYWTVAGHAIALGGRTLTRLSGRTALGCGRSRRLADEAQ